MKMALRSISPRKYVWSYLLLLSPLSLLIFANYAFLRGSGEMYSAHEVVDLQWSRDRLYGTATNHNIYQYKLEIYRRLKPTVVAVGSSRVMQFREGFFNVPFANMGGAMNSLKEGEDLVADMLKIHKPKVVILGLDYWWFNPASDEASDDHLQAGNELNAQKLSFPIDSLKNGKISLSLFARNAVYSIAPCTTCNWIGLNAGVNAEGYGRDGSYYYLGTVTGTRKPLDYRFESQKNSIGHPNPKTSIQLAMPAAISPPRVERLLGILALARKENVKVLVVFPPDAPAIVAEMKRLGVYFDLARAFQGQIPADIPVFDFSDPRKLGPISDCEFIDGIHGGDLLYLRMIANIVRQPDNPLQGYINVDKLGLLDKLSGIAMIPNKFQASNAYEVDFLGMGCIK